MISELNHLKANLYRISPGKFNNINNFRMNFNIKINHTNYSKWLSNLSSKTRLVIEPKIIGIPLILHYSNYNLLNAWDIKYNNILYRLDHIKYLPRVIAIPNDIIIIGELYVEGSNSPLSRAYLNDCLYNNSKKFSELSFISYRIYNSRLNQLQDIKQLTNLSFQPPEVEFTTCTNQIPIYRELWSSSQIFDKYPTSGIVVKINSKSFQLKNSRQSCNTSWLISITS